MNRDTFCYNEITINVIAKKYSNLTFVIIVFLFFIFHDELTTNELGVKINQIFFVSYYKNMQGIKTNKLSHNGLTLYSGSKQNHEKWWNI